MTRFPWETGSAHRGHEDDGSESLHADVMRFMAIIALCLVAIFALVRSLPLNLETEIASQGPKPLPPAEAAPIETPAAPPVAQTLRPRAEPVLRPRPVVHPPTETGDDPRRLPVPERPREVESAPAPVAQARQPIGPATPAPPQAPSPARQGFSLRFASDEALQAMIADGRVRVFARTADGRWWQSERSRAAYFRSGAAPSRLHDMSANTVPAAMLSALRRDAGGIAGTGAVRWGVALPPEIEARIISLVDGGGAGLLVIAASGRVSLQPYDDGADDG
jgi:hypothetical protein